MVFIEHNSLKSDTFFNPIFIQCFLGFMLFKVQVFQSPDFSGSRFFRVQVFQGPGLSGFRFFRDQAQVQVLEVAKQVLVKLRN